MEFYPAALQVQQPDLLGSYVRGRMAPLQIEQQQQQNQAGALKIDQLKMAIDSQRREQQAIQDALSQQQPADTEGTVGGFKPNTLAALTVLRGGDPTQTAMGAQAYTQQKHQLQAQQPLALLDSIEGASSPARIVQNNPGLTARWQQVAPQLGLDPVKDFSDDNVREAIRFARNQVASSVGLPTTAGPAPLTAYQKEEVSLSKERNQIERDRVNISKDKADSFTPEMGQLMGALAERGVSLPTGFRSVQQQQTLYGGLLARNPDKSPDEIADLIKSGKLSLAAETKEVTTAAGVAGRVAVAANEIKTTAPLLLDASAKVSRGNFMPITKLLQAGEASISDPNLRQLRVYVNSMLNAYDLLAARGGTDVAKREQAHSLLTSADSPEALRAAVDAFQSEARAAGDAARMAEGRPVEGQTQNKRLTPEEASKLPPGTRFTGTDGVERVRH